MTVIAESEAAAAEPRSQFPGVQKVRDTFFSLPVWQQFRMSEFVPDFNAEMSRESSGVIVGTIEKIATGPISQEDLAKVVPNAPSSAIITIITMDIQVRVRKSSFDFVAPDSVAKFRIPIFRDGLAKDVDPLQYAESLLDTVRAVLPGGTELAFLAKDVVLEGSTAVAEGIDEFEGVTSLVSLILSTPEGSIQSIDPRQDATLFTTWSGVTTLDDLVARVEKIAAS